MKRDRVNSHWLLRMFLNQIKRLSWFISIIMREQNAISFQRPSSIIVEQLPPPHDSWAVWLSVVFQICLFRYDQSLNERRVRTTLCLHTVWIFCSFYSLSMHILITTRTQSLSSSHFSWETTKMPSTKQNPNNIWIMSKLTVESFKIVSISCAQLEETKANDCSWIASCVTHAWVSSRNCSSQKTNFRLRFQK